MNYEFDLSELEFRLIRDFVHQKFGIFLKDDKLSFVRMKIYPRLVQLGLRSFGDYLNLVKYSKNGHEEVSRMISLLTNNETYFFRENTQLQVFRDFLLPEIRERKQVNNDKTLRIVSAGCSTGEEVYTLAILTFETGSFFWGWDVKIIGVDVDESALEVARSGMYYTRSLRMSDSTYIQKYFASDSGNYKIKDNIKNMTQFIKGNILDEQVWSNLKSADVILCRNVLIYFSEEKLKNVVDNFYETLSPGGFLLLGHSETLTGVFDGFQLKRYPETMVYCK